MSDDFNIEKRLKIVELARSNGMFELRGEAVVNEAIEWFITPRDKRGEPPLYGNVKRLIRILNRLLLKD
tara:strand:+ start:278 stop:484 length:207 start_codon:yes stop_codon:yes gene_type:complete